MNALNNIIFILVCFVAVSIGFIVGVTKSNQKQIEEIHRIVEELEPVKESCWP